MDRISVSFPVKGFAAEATAWSTVTTVKPGTDRQTVNRGTTERVGGARCFIGVSEIAATGQVIGKVELNPSKVEDEARWELAGLEEVEPAVRRAFMVAAEYLEPACLPTEGKVRRLDVARDFDGVRRPGQRIRALAPVHRPWSRRNLVHADPSRNGAQTLMVGSGAGVVRLYDKFEETEGKAPEGTLRWEAECRSEWLKNYASIRHLADITEETCRSLAANRWEWSAMGVETGAMNRVLELVADHPDMTEREKTIFLGWLWRSAAGQGYGVSSSRTLAKFRRWQRELGIAIEPGMLDEDAGGIVSRLDFETGREVFRVPA